MDREKIDNGKNINSGRKHRNGGKKKLKNSGNNIHGGKRI